MMRSLLVGVGCLLAMRVAHADGVTQPLISPDDNATDSFLARYSFRAALGAMYARGGGESAQVYSVQGFVGPFDQTRFASSSLRVRWMVADGSDTSFRAAPFTLALQHYFPVDPLLQAPLLALHFGVELAGSTPWLSDRKVAPPVALSTLGIDTELAGNGWDLRPSGWMRLDFLACRNFYVETGVGSDLFAPAVGSNLVTVAYRVALGFDVGCDHKDLTQIHRPGFLVEYRARGTVWAGDADPSYNDLLAVAAQWVIGPVTIGVHYGYDPLRTFDRYELGVRIQSGGGRNR